MTKLLQRYNFRPAADTETNQIVHIVLLELVIDRYYELYLSHFVTGHLTRIFICLRFVDAYKQNEK